MAQKRARTQRANDNPEARMQYSNVLRNLALGNNGCEARESKTEK